MLHMHTHITRICLTRSQTETNKATKPFKQSNNNKDRLTVAPLDSEVQNFTQTPAHNPVVCLPTHFTNCFKVTLN
jgi:hypothetical protein